MRLGRQGAGCGSSCLRGCHEGEHRQCCPLRQHAWRASPEHARGRCTHVQAGTAGAANWSLQPCLAPQPALRAPASHTSTPAHQHTSTPCGQSSGAGPRAFKPYAGPRPSRPSRYGWQLAYRGRAAGSGPVAPPSAQSWAGWCVRRRRRRSAQPQAEASCAPGVAASRVNEGNYPGLIGLTPIGLPLPHAVCLRGLIWQGTVLMTCSSLDDRRRPAATSWRLARGRVA